MRLMRPVSRAAWLRNPLGVVVILASALILSSPAFALGKLFSIDFNGNQLNELTGVDDLPFSFMGVDSGGDPALVSGIIRAVDILTMTAPQMDGEVAVYEDFLSAACCPGSFADTNNGGTDTPGTFSGLSSMDTLIFDLVLDAGSGVIDAIGVGVTTDPLFLDPDGAGYFVSCITGLELGCRSAVTSPVGGEIPNDGFNPPIEVIPGFFPFFPGGALFRFSEDFAAAGNITGGETSIRMFVSWEDTGLGSPLTKINQVAVFMLSSGASNQDFFTNIVPEPGTGLLLALGLGGLAIASRRRS